MARRLSERRGARRRLGILLLVLAVAALHGLGLQVVAERLGSQASGPAMPPRIEVAYVRELTPSPAPLVGAGLPAAPPAVVQRRVALQAMTSASAPRTGAASKSKGEKATVKAKPRRAASATAIAKAKDNGRMQARSTAHLAAGTHLSAATDRIAAARSVGSVAEQEVDRDLMPSTQDGRIDVVPGLNEQLVTVLPGAATSASGASGAGGVDGADGAKGASGANVASGTNGLNDRNIGADAANDVGVDAVDAAAKSSAAPFVWPASTRVSYVLTGNYRGPVQGDAQVEWVHIGSRYQVHLDLTVGASFAPLITRRMTSDGELTAAGLAPTRYDQETKLIFHDRHRASLRFEPDAVVLADGRRRARMPGVQDSASQFIQLTYLFTTQPGLLRVGHAVELPLALPRKLDRWTYDVADEEVLQTSFGPLSTFHLKPRRLPRPGGDLVAEIWFAPDLRYLPVRIRISQDAETYIDLLIARKPELAAS